jgi:hypothetical protein
MAELDVDGYRRFCREVYDAWGSPEFGWVFRNPFSRLREKMKEDQIFSMKRCKPRDSSLGFSYIIGEDPLGDYVGIDIKPLIDRIDKVKSSIDAYLDGKLKEKLAQAASIAKGYAIEMIEFASRLREINNVVPIHNLPEPQIAMLCDSFNLLEASSSIAFNVQSGYYLFEHEHDLLDLVGIRPGPGKTPHLDLVLNLPGYDVKEGKRIASSLLWGGDVKRPCKPAPPSIGAHLSILTSPREPKITPYHWVPSLTFIKSEAISDERAILPMALREGDKIRMADIPDGFFQLHQVRELTLLPKRNKLIQGLLYLRSREPMPSELREELEEMPAGKRMLRKKKRFPSLQQIVRELYLPYRLSPLLIRYREAVIQSTTSLMKNYNKDTNIGKCCPVRLLGLCLNAQAEVRGTRGVLHRYMDELTTLSLHHDPVGYIA